MTEIMVLFLVVASGFVASGVVASFYVLVTGAKAPVPKTDFQRLAVVGLTIFTGPSMLTTNALKTGEDQPAGYRWLMLAITLLWSYLLGLLVVSLALALPSPF